MSTPPTPPPYGQEGAYATHPGAAVPVPPAPPAVPASTPPAYAAPAYVHAPADAPAGGYGPAGVHPGTGASWAGASWAPPARTSPPRNDLAVWSLVLGLLGICGFLLLTGVPAILVGRSARRAVAAGEADNEGTATAGIVLGWVSTVLGLLLGAVVVLVVLVPFLLIGLAAPFAALG